MKVAYVDTSCIIAIAFREPGAKDVLHRLKRFDELISSDLMFAELRSAFAREKVDFPAELTSAVGRLLPDRPLDEECERALSAGYLRGADLWHVACALFIAPQPEMIHFVSLDQRQTGVAKKLGFKR